MLDNHILYSLLEDIITAYNEETAVEIDLSLEVLRYLGMSFQPQVAFIICRYGDKQYCVSRKRFPAWIRKVAELFKDWIAETAMSEDMVEAFHQNLDNIQSS